MTLHIICDISGSMAEGGKSFITRTVVLSIAQWLNLGYVHPQMKLYGWAEDILEFPDWVLEDDFPVELTTCRGSALWSPLIQFFDDQNEGRVLFLTDGFWTRKGEMSLRRWKNSLVPSSLRFIKIGADANPSLKGDDVFIAEEIFAALDGWLEGGLV